MANGIYSALSGAMTNMRQIEVISHNMANVSTPGFKMEKLAAQAINSTNGNKELTFAMPEAPMVDLTPGPMVSTGNPMDLAFTEGVYLKVSEAGNTAYVRSATLSVQPDGKLIDSMGNGVYGEQDIIRIPEGAKEIVIGTNGELTVDGNQVDKLRLVSFQNEQALAPGGNQSFVDPGGARELPAETGAPVMSGYREQANFSAVKQMTDMIAAHRTYDITMNAIRTFGQIEKKGATGIARQ